MGLTAVYPTPARRPASGVLDTHRMESPLERPLPDWRDALGRVLDDLAMEHGISRRADGSALPLVLEDGRSRATRHAPTAASLRSSSASISSTISSRLRVIDHCGKCDFSLERSEM